MVTISVILGSMTVKASPTLFYQISFTLNRKFRSRSFWSIAGLWAGRYCLLLSNLSGCGVQMKSCRPAEQFQEEPWLSICLFCTGKLRIQESIAETMRQHFGCGQNFVVDTILRIQFWNVASFFSSNRFGRFESDIYGKQRHLLPRTSPIS